MGATPATKWPPLACAVDPEAQCLPASARPNPAADRWALNDEAVANLGYMQLKKTHDAAMVLMQRAYGDRPRYNYFIGSSQGGRESLTVAQRYPADYDGIAAEVPIVNFSTLMLAPELIRIQEKPAANWVPPAKVNAIRGEFMRQCDKLDGLVDGVINNYMACRAIFDVKQGDPNRHPWAAKRCPNHVDPNPQDTSAAACLTDGQISTLKMVYSPYVFATPLANGVKSFGMWVPNTDPSGSGLIANVRYRGQEGAAENAPDPQPPGCFGGDRIPHAGPDCEPFGLRGRRSAEQAPRGTLRHSRFHQSGFERVPEAGRQVDRSDRHERHLGVAGRSVGLLSVGAGQDGPRSGGFLRPFLCAAADRSRTRGKKLQRRWRRQRDRGPADSEHVTTGWA
jgi:hypothetical protein